MLGALERELGQAGGRQQCPGLLGGQRKQEWKKAIGLGSEEVTCDIRGKSEHSAAELGSEWEWRDGR